MTDTADKIPLGISSCLIGEKVRFDGGHKQNRYVLDTLGQYFAFRPFCPEMAIGLEAVQAWCIDTVVLRRREIHEPFMLHRRLLEAGYEPARTLRRHTVYQLNTPCTPTRP